MRKPLFTIQSTDDMIQTTPMESSSAVKIDGKIIYQGDSLNELKQSIGDLTDNTVIKFKTEGAWSMHELVSYLVERIGPSDMCMSTWAMSEAPARALFGLKQKGLIKSLKCLFDYRIKVRSGEAFQLISAIADQINLTKCHAKVATLINDDWAVSIVGSSNFSKNPRVEAGTIFINREAALYDKDWLTKLIEDESKQ